LRAGLLGQGRGATKNQKEQKARTFPKIHSFFRHCFSLFQINW